MDDIFIGTDEHGEDVLLPERNLRRHSVLFGGSGSGKSVAMMRMEFGQLSGGPCSLIAIDAKMASVRRLRGLCQEAHIKSERVWTISALDPGAAPRMNPLLAGDPAECAAMLVGILESSGVDTVGPMGQYIRYALLAGSWHGLRLSEVPPLLTDKSFRDLVFKRPARWETNDPLYRRVRDFFTRRFAAKDERASESAQAADRKFDQLMANRLFLSMFESDGNDLDLESLFHDPGAVLIHAGKGGGVTPSDQMLLSGMIVGAITHLAGAGVTGKVPIILAVDEAGVQARSLAEPLSDVVNLLREAGIRLLISAQHPGQLPDALRDNVQESTEVKLFFRPGGDSAADYARMLDRAPRPTVPPPYKGKLLSCHSGTAAVTPMRAKILPPLRDLVIDPTRVGEQLKKFASFDTTARPPVFTEDGRTFAEAFGGFPAGTVRLRWRESFAWAEAEMPAVDWERDVAALGNGKAAAIIGNSVPKLVSIRYFQPRDPDDSYGWRRPQAPPPPALVDEEEEEKEEDYGDGSF